MASKSKSKATTFSPVTKALNANLTNSTFGFLSSAGWKGKSPASSSKSVDVQPDLDLLGGFAFLSFASLDELETHIEHNESTSSAISVNVGQKRKAVASEKRQGESSGLYVPPSKKKATSTAKKKSAPKQLTSTLTTAKPSFTNGSRKHKTDQVSSVGTILVDRELSRLAPIDISASGSEMIEPSSSNVFSEISLLCSETVDLGDDEDVPQDVCKKPAKDAPESSDRDIGSGQVEVPPAEINQTEGVVEGIATSTDPIPKKKKKKKKRKNEHCDQTSQTKFRIKKKAKSVSKGQASEGTSNVLSGEMKNDAFPDWLSQDDDNLHIRTSNDEDGNKSQVKYLLSRPKVEHASCARTMVCKGYTKENGFKIKLNASGSSSGENSIGLKHDTTSEPSQAKTVENISLDGSIPHSKEQENDMGEESTSVSVLSDLSDHSSDLEMFMDRCGCFLLNNKIEKVEKEDVEMGEGAVDVDVESVGKETRKNFLVVSGIEAGHFSYHPGVTKDGTIDTSIQALPNEIDIFLQCAKMQEGEMIKIINPDDSEELNSHFTQNNGRNPEAVKAVRSATERKRRHHLGDLFNDVKLEVFTDLVDVDLYFSKQAILSKAINTIEELEKQSKELSSAKKQLMKKNKMLKEKRNLLMSGKESTDVDPANVDAIFRQLNIKLDDEETLKTEENSNSSQDVVDKAGSESKVAVEPCVKGRPRAKKTLLAPWVSNNKPVPKSKDDLSRTATNLPQKATTQAPLEASKEILATATSSSQAVPSANVFNVSCGVQTQEEGKDFLKSFTIGNPPISQSLPAESGTAKSKPISESTSQEGAKPSLVKILPKPAILHLNPTQQNVMIMDTLGQVKQPSSDKIICNLSRLSTMQSPSSSSSICFIRGGQLMKSLDSKNVMHIKINDDPKNVSSVSCSTSTVSTLSQQVSSTTATTNMPGFLTLGVPKPPEAPSISNVQAAQKYLEKPVLISQIPLKPATTQVLSTTTATNMPGYLTLGVAKPLEALSTSAAQTSQKHPEEPVLVSQIPLKSTTTQALSMATATSMPGFLTLGVAKTPEATNTSSVQTSQTLAEKPVLVSQIPLKSTTTQVFTTANATNMPGLLTFNVAKTPQAPGTSSVQTSQKQLEQPVLVSQTPLKSTTTQVLTTATATKMPGLLTFSVANIPQAPGTSSVQASRKHPENTLLVSQNPLKLTTSQVSSTTTETNIPGFVTLGVAKMPEAPKTSTVQTERPLLISPIPLKSATTQVSSTTTTTNVPGFVTLGVAKAPQGPGPLSVQTSQKLPENALLVSPIPLKSPTAQVSSTATASNIPGFLTFSVAKVPNAPGTSSVQSSQKLPKNALLVSQIPLNSTTTPTVIFTGKPLSMLTSSAGSLQSRSQPSSEMTMRALASLSQLQANRPPLVGTVGKPVALNENPVAGILSGLKNVVMKVVPGQPEVQSTRSSIPTVPTTPKTTATKGAMSSEASVASSQGKHPATTRTFSVIPIISVPTSSSLNSSFTVSALNQPSSSSGISAKDDTIAPFIKPCLDPFNLVPKQPVASSPTIELEPSPDPSTSLDLESEIDKELVDNLTSSESPSPTPDDIFTDEPLGSSTVLTQEMLNIPGIEQRPDVPLAKLSEVFENLADLDKTSDTELPEPSCEAEERKSEGLDACNVSSSSRGSEVQTGVPSSPLRISAISAKKSTSPLKVEIKDFRKGKPFQPDME